MSALSDQIKVEYSDALDEVGETVFIRRKTSGVPTDYAARARIVGYEPHQIAGTIQQGDRKLIVYADDLITAGLSGKVLTTDFAVVRGKQLAIIAVDDSTRRVAGELIAYELQARG